MDRLRIVLADDHPLVLMGMRDLLEKDLSFDVVGALSSPTDLIRHLAQDRRMSSSPTIRCRATIPMATACVWSSTW